MNSSEKVSLPLLVKIQVVLAVVATVVTIALAAYIPTLVQRKSQLDAQIEQLKAQRKQLEEQIVCLEKQKAEAEKLGSEVASAYYASNPKQAQKTLEASVSSVPDAAVHPRIFLHIRSASQRPAARQVADTLRQQSYLVPGIQILVDSGPDETQVRYFHHPADEAEAQKILDQLTASGVKHVAPKPNFISGQVEIRQRQYEIWFAPDSL